MHCLLPNRPPSPNTFYERWWAPEFTYMLMSRLENAAMNIEPSKRIWWREEFGGCAPDREPLDSEIWNMKYKDRGNVLRTSPPPSEDQPQVSQQDQRSKGLLTTQSSSPDEAPTVRRKARSPKSPTHYIPDRLPPLKIPDPATMKASRPKPRVYTAEEDEQILQSALRKQEKYQLERLRLYGIPLDQGEILPAKSSLPIPQVDRFEQVPNNIPVQDKAPKPEERQQVKRSPTDEYPKRPRPDWNYSPPLRSHGSTSTEEQRESLLGGSSVRPKARSPKSPTHYVPDRLPPLKTPDSFKEHPARRAFRKSKKLPAEQEEKPLQADLQWLKARGLENPQAHTVYPKAQSPKSPTHYTPDKVPLRDHDGLLPTESSLSISQSDRFEQIPTNIPIQDKTSKPEEHQQLKQSLYQKIEAMNLRRSQRRGVTIRQSENANSAYSHSVSHGDPVEEDLSVAEMFPASVELRQLKPSLLKKIEAMRLRRSRRHGTAIYRSKASVPLGSDSTSQHVEVGEASSKPELQRRSSEASPQQLEPSLCNKVEAVKRRLSRQQGTSTYQAEETRDQDSASPSPLVQAPGVLLDTQVQKQNLMPEKPRNFRVHSCRDIEAVKLGKSSRQGIGQSV